MKKILSTLTVLISALSSLSANACTASGCIATISELYTTADGVIYVSTPLDEKLANCTAVSDKYFTINPSSKNAKEMYSSVLAAYMSGKKIQLRVIEGHSQCQLAYVRLSVDF